MDIELPSDDQDFIIEKRVEGWEPELISHALRHEENSPLREETVREFLELDETQERIEREKELIEKRAEVSREDLIRELKEEIKHIREQRQRLEGSNDEIGSQETKNLLKAIKSLGELIDVLEDKDGGSSGNVVNVNKLEQNFQFNKMVKHMPAEDKKDVAEQLADDPDVENFVIEKKQ